MPILLKVSDTSNQMIDFEVIESHQLEKETLNNIFNMYFCNDTSDDTNKILKLIYPNHTEIYTQFKINYLRKR